MKIFDSRRASIKRLSWASSTYLGYSSNLRISWYNGSDSQEVDRPRCAMELHIVQQWMCSEHKLVYQSSTRKWKKKLPVCRVKMPLHSLTFSICFEESVHDRALVWKSWLGAITQTLVGALIKVATLRCQGTFAPFDDAHNLAKNKGDICWYTWVNY